MHAVVGRLPEAAALVTDGPFSVRFPVDVHRVNDHVSIPIHRDVGFVHLRIERWGERGTRDEVRSNKLRLACGSAGGRGGGRLGGRGGGGHAGARLGGGRTRAGGYSGGRAGGRSGGRCGGGQCGGGPHARPDGHDRGRRDGGGDERFSSASPVRPYACADGGDDGW
eukprot:3727116-Pyramimonas_sp.AAC.2